MNSESKVSQKELSLTNEEQLSYQYLKQHSNEWAELFLNILPDGRDKITARLMGSLYRENLVGGYTHSQIVAPHLLSSDLLNEGEMLSIHFPKQDISLCGEIIGQHAFNRIDVKGPFYWKKHDQFTRVLHPNELLRVILSEDPSLEGDNSEQFADDLENSATHMSLALSYQSLQYQQHGLSLYDLITSQQDPYLTSEQSVVEGHPIHPGAKLRKGMNTEETIAYASEYGHEVDLQFVLIHHSLTRKQSVRKCYEDLVFEMFSGLKDAIEAQFSEDISLDEYDVMVIHPWQYKEIMNRDYSEELHSKKIIPIRYEAPYYAGLSFRTLMPKFPNKSPHIKLSTNVHITGEIRTLSEQTTHNGPLMTHILQSIEKNDAWFQPLNTQSVPEWAGIHFFDSSDDASIQEQRSEQLGTLYRENIYHAVTEEEFPIIPSSLVSASSNQSLPLIIDIIKKYQQYTQKDEQTSICSWFETYANSLIDYVMPLLVKYGIALEAHLQNTIVTINKKTSAVSKMFIRDFEGLRIDEHQLNATGYDTSHFHEKSRILTQSESTVFNKAFYSTIQNHLGELVACISKHFASSGLEEALWQLVRNRLDNVMSKAQANNVSSTRIQKFNAVFFSPQIDYKCVTTMRLLDEAHAYTYIKVDNPLKK